ncbi:gas vesicle protein [Pseudonocardia zijingensis]|uniref:Gas vesicle protein GvpO n=1 Tax=Pseudonocardia zijingensis TaxID=153376 RepID=A0ABN1QX30_9PSEU
MADEERTDDREPRRRPARGGGPALAARKAAEHVAEFTGRSPECVISIDGTDDGWKVGVEVVEIRRIPDTQDVLAIYEVEVGRDGALKSYKRVRRYARGELDGRCR